MDQPIAPQPEVSQQQVDAVQLQQQSQQPQEPLHKSHIKIYAVSLIVIVIAIGAIFYLKGNFQSAASSLSTPASGPITTHASNQSAGQSGQASESPEQMLESYQGIANSAGGYQVSYKITSQSLATLGPINISTYVLNNMTRKITMGLEGSTIALYMIKGDWTLCSEGLGGGTQVECSSLNGSSSSDMALQSELQSLSPSETVGRYTNSSFISGETISYIGAKEIVGRSCDAFSVVTPGSVYAHMEAHNSSATSVGPLLQEFANDTFYASVCLDKSTGVVLEAIVNMSAYSKLLAKNQTTTLINMTATGFSTSVSASDFVIPSNSSTTT